MWSRCSKLIIAFLLAELALIEPPLLQAGGYDQGQQAGQDLLNRFQSPSTLQQKLPTIPNYSDAARDQQLGNPYYSQDPITTRGAITQFQHDTTKALNVPQGVAGQATSTIRNRAASPWAWTFGTSSSVLKQMQSHIPPGVSIQQGCQPQQYCAIPSTATSVTQTCNVTQTLQTATCTDQYTLQTQPDGTQIEVHQDGCASYKQPPWWQLSGTCQDPQSTPNCRTYQTLVTQTMRLCTDHYLDVRIAQIGTEIHLQTQDRSPSGGFHGNCESDHTDWWHDLAIYPADQLPDPPSFTVSASGSGCSSGTTTLTGIDALAHNLITCPSIGAQRPTLSWTVPVFQTACHACWTTEQTFANTITSSNNCQTLENQGCTLSGQQCLDQSCTQLTRTYSCPGPTDQTTCNQWQDYLLCSTCIPDPPGPPRCIDTSYPANGDFSSAAAAMEGDVTLSRDREAAVQIFPGDQSWCTQNPINDCCAEGADAAGNLRTAITVMGYTFRTTQAAIGAYYLYTDFEYFRLVAQNSSIFRAALNLNDVIGDYIASVIQDMLPEAAGESAAADMIAYFQPYLVAVQLLWMAIQMLTACSPKSLDTATKIDLKLCHRVGSWCEVSLLLFCSETIVGYCCFHTVLARIIQEQGRDQLGLSWGGPKQPNCGGLSVEQLSRIDFSQIDLSEYIDDLKDRMRWPDATDTTSKQNNTSKLPLADSVQHSIAGYGSLGDRIQNAIATPPPPPNTLTLSLIINGSGTITASPGGSCSASCSVTIPSNTPIMLTATPAAGWSFLNWSNACSGIDPCTITPTTPITVTAIFDTVQVALTAMVGIGGTVVSSPSGISCNNATCTSLFDLGTTVTLTATPANATWYFVGWNGDCSGTGTCALTLNMPHQAGAVFFQIAQIVTFSVNTTFPAPANVPITWTTNTIHGTPPIQYQYTREDNGSSTIVQDWGPTSTYTWMTNSTSVGIHRLQVLVRSNGSTAPYEDWRITDPFTILPPLQVTGITPSNGARNAVITTTISGQSFRMGDTITLSGNGITISGISVLSDSQIQATFTIDIAAAPGPRNLTITDPAGVSATLPGGFTVF